MASMYEFDRHVPRVLIARYPDKRRRQRRALDPLTSPRVSGFAHRVEPGDVTYDELMVACSHVEDGGTMRSGAGAGSGNEKF